MEADGADRWPDLTSRSVPAGIVRMGIADLIARPATIVRLHRAHEALGRVIDRAAGPGRPTSGPGRPRPSGGPGRPRPTGGPTRPPSFGGPGYDRGRPSDPGGYDRDRPQGAGGRERPRPPAASGTQRPGVGPDGSGSRPPPPRPGYGSRPPPPRPGYGPRPGDRPRGGAYGAPGRPPGRGGYQGGSARPDREDHAARTWAAPRSGGPPPRVWVRASAEAGWQQRADAALAPPEHIGDDEEIVAGRRPVEEAFAARRPSRRLLVVPERRAALDQLVLHATALRIPVVEVEGGTLTSLTGFDGHQGVALVVEPRRWATLDDVMARARERHEAPLVLVLDSLEDPRTWARCCAAPRPAAFMACCSRCGDRRPSGRRPSRPRQVPWSTS